MRYQTAPRPGADDRIRTGAESLEGSSATTTPRPQSLDYRPADCSSLALERLLAEDGGVKLLQIPFSHNSIKVRRALALKGLAYERENVNPAIRRRLIKVSGQPLTPVL